MCPPSGSIRSNNSRHPVTDDGVSVEIQPIRQYMRYALLEFDHDFIEVFHPVQNGFHIETEHAWRAIIAWQSGRGPRHARSSRITPGQASERKNIIVA